MSRASRQQFPFRLPLLLLLGYALAFFQSCDGFHPATPAASASVQAAPLQPAPAPSPHSSTGILSLVTDQSSVLPQAPFTVTADLSGFPSDTNFLWSHDFGDGLSYCNQTTPLTNLSSTLECPAFGSAKVILTAVAADGTSKLYSIVVNVDGAAGAQPNPNPGPNPNPAPNPSPMPLPAPMPLPPPLSANAQLYNQECASCHGLLPGQSNRMGITLSQLQNALATVPNMAFLKSQLTLAQQMAIISALN